MNASRRVKIRIKKRKYIETPGKPAEKPPELPLQSEWSFLFPKKPEAPDGEDEEDKEDEKDEYALLWDR